MANNLLILVCTLIIVCLRKVNGECQPTLTTVSGSQTRGLKNLCAGDLIFEDNFETFNTELWQHNVDFIGGYNGEFEVYINNRSNSYVESGILHIRPSFVADDYSNDFLYSGTLDLDGSCTGNQGTAECVKTGTQDYIINPIKNAKVTTANTFSFKYGKFEVRAKAPVGDWFWPAIWILPKSNVYGTWPASGEIDIMELRGNRNLVDASGVNIGIEQQGSSLHFGPNSNFVRGPTYTVQKAAGFNSDFVRYQVEWTPEKIEFSVDDVVTGTLQAPENGLWGAFNLDESGQTNPWAGATNLAPFDQEFYIIINFAVGGTNGFFPDTAQNTGGKPWQNSSPRAMAQFWEGREQWLSTWNMENDDTHLEVDYIKIWAV